MVVASSSARCCLTGAASFFQYLFNWQKNTAIQRNNNAAQNKTRDPGLTLLCLSVCLYPVNRLTFWMAPHTRVLTIESVKHSVLGYYNNAQMQSWWPSGMVAHKATLLQFAKCKRVKQEADMSCRHSTPSNAIMNALHSYGRAGLLVPIRTSSTSTASVLIGALDSDCSFQ